MRVYMAAAIYNSMHIGGPVFNRLTPVQQAHRMGCENLLESYHYYNKPKHIEATRQGNEKVFLDSGAFSAFTQGVEIDLPTYCRFIQENADVIEVASVLDAIGDPQKTYENQKAMEALGVRPLPCFHSGEDGRYCEYYVANYEHMTLGGMVGASTPALIKWLDTIWERYLTDGAGRPKVKVHGFGITSIPIMKRYPWYSVDSSSWLQVSSIGAVLHPDWGTINLSATSPSRKQEGQHFDTLAPIHQEALAREFEGLGYSVEELRTSYLARRTFCMWAYMELQKRISGTRQEFVNEQPGFF